MTIEEAERFEGELRESRKCHRANRITLYDM